MKYIHGWKISTFFFGILCLILIYRVFDQGITATYQKESAESTAKQIDVLVGLMQHEWLGLPEDQVLSKLRAYASSRPPDEVILKTEPDKNVVYLEGFQFKFRNGRLTKIN